MRSKFQAPVSNGGEKVADAMLTVANLKEELAIAEKTAKEYKEKMTQETEKYRQKTSAASEQIQQFKEDIDDKDAIISQLNGKVEIL